MESRPDNLSEYSRNPNPTSFISSSSSPQRRSWSKVPGSQSRSPSSPVSGDQGPEDLLRPSSLSSPSPSHSITELDPFGSVRHFSPYAFPLAVNVQLPPSAREKWTSGRGRMYASFARRSGASTSPPRASSGLTPHPETSINVLPPGVAVRHPSDSRRHQSWEQPRGLSSPPNDSKLHPNPRAPPTSLRWAPAAPPVTPDPERPRISGLTHISRPTMKLLVDEDNLSSELNFIRQRRLEREKEVANVVREMRAEKRKAKKRLALTDLSHSKEATLEDEGKDGSSSLSKRGSAGLPTPQETPRAAVVSTVHLSMPSYHARITPGSSMH